MLCDYCDYPFYSMCEICSKYMCESCANKCACGTIVCKLHSEQCNLCNITRCKWCIRKCSYCFNYGCETPNCVSAYTSIGYPMLVCNMFCSKCHKLLQHTYSNIKINFYIFKSKKTIYVGSFDKKFTFKLSIIQFIL